MSIRTSIRGRLGGGEEGGEELAQLLAAAREDAGLRGQILWLLRASKEQREALINTALHEMRLRGEPPGVCAAFAALATEAGAEVAREFLGES